MADDFYPFVDSGDPAPDNEHITGVADGADSEGGASSEMAGFATRISIYDDMFSTPRVIVIDPAPVRTYLEEITNTVYRCMKEQGGTLSLMVIRELVENFIHAHFVEPIISILDGGNTIRFADQGVHTAHLVGVERITVDPSPVHGPFLKFRKGIGKAGPGPVDEQKIELVPVHRRADKEFETGPLRLRIHRNGSLQKKFHGRWGRGFLPLQLKESVGTKFSRDCGGLFQLPLPRIPEVRKWTDHRRGAQQPEQKK